MWIFSRRWSRELEALMRCIDAQELGEAAVHLENALEAVSRFPQSDPRRLMVSLELARMEFYSDRYQAAILTIKHVLQHSDSTKHIYQNTYSKALLMMAETLGIAGENNDAEEYFQKAVEYREITYGAESKDVAIALNRYADFLREVQRFSEARDLLERAERIIRISR